MYSGSANLAILACPGGERFADAVCDAYVDFFADFIAVKDKDDLYTKGAW